MHSIGSRVRRWLALGWSSFTIVLLLRISVLILGDSKFPLNVGIIKTTGRAGLWATLLPSLIGLAAVALVLWHSRLGLRLLGIYSLFWTAIVVSALPAVWNAKRSFCIRTFCITTPWLGRLLVFALAMPFLLVAFWTRSKAAQPVHPAISY